MEAYRSNQRALKRPRQPQQQQQPQPPQQQQSGHQQSGQPYTSNYANYWTQPRFYPKPVPTATVTYSATVKEEEEDDDDDEVVFVTSKSRALLASKNIPPRPQCRPTFQSTSNFAASTSHFSAPPPPSSSSSLLPGSTTPSCLKILYGGKYGDFWKCRIPGCNAKYIRRHNMINHEARHTGQTLFRCKAPQCRFLGANQADIVEHIRKEHVVGKKRTVVAASR